MKLLKRQTILLQEAIEKKNQIDEGVALAKRIDALRQTLLSLEAQHKAYISGMQNELEAQTSPLIERIASLKAKIPILEEKRKSLLEPLDDKWREVRTKEASVDDLIKKALEARESYARKESQMEVKSKKLQESLTKAKTREHEIDRALIRAQEARIESESVLSVAIQEREVSQKEIEDRERIVKEREDAIGYKEVDLENRKADLAQKVEANRVERIQLRDQWATLEREMQRIKNIKEKDASSSNIQ